MKKYEWVLRNKKTKTAFFYSLTKFQSFEEICKRKIKKGLDYLYQIEYYCNDELIEKVELADYFNSITYHKTNINL